MGLFRNCNKSDWPFSIFSLISFGDDLPSFIILFICRSQNSQHEEDRLVLQNISQIVTG